MEVLRRCLAKGFRERARRADTEPRLVSCEEALPRHNRLDVFKATVGGARWPSLEDLESLQLPIGILAGETDDLTPVEAGRALHRQLPRWSFEVLACRHLLMLAKRAEGNQLFLASVQAGVSSLAHA